MNDNQMTLNEKIWSELKGISEKLKTSRGEEEISQCILAGVRKLCQPKFLDLPPRFSNAFSKFQRHEGILYTLPYYRDHFIHMFHVFYLGYLIINGWWNNNIAFLKEEDKDEKNVILRTWFIASIQHDIALPVEMAEFWVPRFPKEALDLDVEIRSNFDWSPIILAGANTSHIEEMTKIFLHPLKESNANKDEIYRKEIAFKSWFNKQLLEKHDHGALGSLSLLNFEWPEADLEHAYAAALNVVLHNYWKTRDETIGELPFSSYPLAFLLTYCDTVQEWGRAQTEPRKDLDRLVDPSTKFSILEIDEHHTAVALSYNIEERCRESVEAWSRLSESAQMDLIYRQRDEIRTSIDRSVSLVSLAWGRGNRPHTFELKAQDENGNEFYTTTII